MSEAYWCMVFVWGTFALIIFNEMLNNKEGEE